MRAGSLPRGPRQLALAPAVALGSFPPSLPSSSLLPPSLLPPPSSFAPFLAPIDAGPGPATTPHPPARIARCPPVPPSLRDPACEASPGIPAAAAAVASSHMYSPRPVGAGPRVGRSRLRTGADLASHHYAIVPRRRGLPYKVGRHPRPQKAAPRLRTWTERKPRPAMMGAVNWPSRASSPVRVQASHPWTSLDSPCSGSGIWDRKCFAELTWTASSCKAPVDLVTGHPRCLADMAPSRR